jgi:anti-sigma factor RsiW
MNHPAPETWMAYLYAELPPTAREDCEAHLRTCPACRVSVENWRATMGALNTDHATLALPRRRPAAARWQPALRWALAASVVLGAGFLAGRATGPSRADLKKEVAAAREQLSAELAQRHDADLQSVTVATVATTAAENHKFLADFTRQLNQARTAERRDLLGALQAYEDRRVMDYTELRDGINQLARKTGTGFRQAESQLNLLANYLPSDASSSNQTDITQPANQERNP